ncbi:unnamed protein product [Arabidopsis lyrata]|uniref:Predicted protein n=1 Tax=Arabidopsis lyrata subsp. lyrata TaxID=81972 RepID=D7KV85_ARALL|nr:predicted protein [Arabidopsis lyrata subsp. lyrata]CAH8258541.1 unnamed protein product [Arabidopsis lyrata]
MRSPEVKAKHDEELRKAQIQAALSLKEYSGLRNEHYVQLKAFKEDDCKKNKISRAQIVSLC